MEIEFVPPTIGEYIRQLDVDDLENLAIGLILETDSGVTEAKLANLRAMYEKYVEEERILYEACFDETDDNLS